MKKTVLFLFCLFGLFQSCEDPELDNSVNVITEDVLYVSGDRLIVTGRILAVTNVQISDHGFELSTDENFSNSIIVTLGERTLPGSFVGESNALEIESKYYCRAFIVDQEERKLGNVLTFNSLLPTLSDYTPKIANVGQPITITGTNFTASTEVYFGKIKVDVISIEGESVIQVKAPPIDDSAVVDVRLEANGKSFTFPDKFEYIVGRWTSLGDPFDEKLYYGNVSYQENGKLYFGLGSNTGAFGLLKDFFQINPDNGDFLQRPFPFIPTLRPYFDYPYMGGGSTTTIGQNQMTLSISSEFLKMENGTFTKLNNPPFLLYDAQGFSNGEDFYVYGGEDSNRDRNMNIYYYQSADQTWSVVGQAPLRINGAKPNFKVGDKHYFFSTDLTIWSYSLTNQEWLEVTTFPEQTSPGGFVQPINGNVYFGLMDNSRNVWKYEIDKNVWKPKPGIPNITNAHTAASWLVGDKIYVFTKTTPNFSLHRLWIFEPEAF